MVAGAPNTIKTASLNMDVEKASRKRPSQTCLHCDFRSESPTILTQHLWENHPLRMRRKQHLFKSVNVNNSKPTETENKQYKTESKECTQDMTNRLLQDADKATSSGRANINKERSQGRSQVQGHFPVDDKTEENSTNDKPQLSALDKYQHNISVGNNCLYNGNAVYVPEQFMSLPFASSTGVIHQVAIPIQANQLNNYTLNAFTKVYLANAMNLQFHQNKLNASDVSQNSSTTTNYTYPTSTASTSSSLKFAVQQPIVPNKSSSTSKNETNNNQSSLMKLVQRNNDRMKSKWQHRTPNQASHKPEPRTRTKQSGKTNIDNIKPKKSSAKTNSLIDNDRMEALEEALRKVCFYDVNDTSSVMPFKCPDNVWRMARFKCIRGVWLVQLPDSDNPTIYVPLQKSQHHKSSIQHALEKSRFNKSTNNYFSQHIGIKENDMEVGNSVPTNKTNDMFTNVGRSEVKARRVQSTVKSGNVLRSLLIGSGTCKGGANNHTVSKQLGPILPYNNTLCKKTMVDAKAY